MDSCSRRLATPYMGDQGIDAKIKMLEGENSDQRIVAYRSLHGPVMT